MSRPQNDVRSILTNASDSLKILWKQRDIALEYEKDKGIEPRTSDRYLKAQAKVDEHFLPPEPKAKRKKPKKKTYAPDDDWAY